VAHTHLSDVNPAVLVVVVGLEKALLQLDQHRIGHDLGGRKRTKEKGK
jgi:hypothetical protein